MTSLTPAKDVAPGIVSVVRRHLAGYRLIVLLAAAGIAAGLAFNWSWLVPAGVAPLLLGVLPCVAMCALGLCMNRMTSHSCPSEDVSEKATEVTEEMMPVNAKAPH